jgi:ribosome recycling factor
MPSGQQLPRFPLSRVRAKLLPWTWAQAHTTPYEEKEVERMNVKELLADVDQKMKGIVEGTRRECASIRTGRASISLVDGINVEAYGGKSPIRQLANISCPDARTIMIQPWDRSILRDIEKAIQTSDLGINPSNDGNVIRLNIPPLTEERRKDLAKQVKKLGEEGKISLRNVRREANDDLKAAQKDGDVPEDESKRATEKVQKTLDENIKKIDTLVEEKNQEITEF